MLPGSAGALRRPAPDVAPVEEKHALFAGTAARVYGIAHLLA
jgi:hypothetical protein